MCLFDRVNVCCRRLNSLDWRPHFLHPLAGVVRLYESNLCPIFCALSVLFRRLKQLVCLNILAKQRINHRNRYRPTNWRFSEILTAIMGSWLRSSRTDPSCQRCPQATVLLCEAKSLWKFLLIDLFLNIINFNTYITSQAVIQVCDVYYSDKQID